MKVREVTQRMGGDLARAGIELRVDETDGALEWGEVVLAVSGTVTLHVVAHGKPLVALYNVRRWQWELVGRWVIRTRTFTLPNLLGETLGLGRVIPELVPHFGSVEPVRAALAGLIQDAAARQRQVTAFAQIAEACAGTGYAAAATGKILELLDPTATSS